MHLTQLEQNDQLDKGNQCEQKKQTQKHEMNLYESKLFEPPRCQVYEKKL
tara:strand:+ start:2966 stop:3115 length:150 start_codon:yes stop_codon:yes gene_type:complete